MQIASILTPMSDHHLRLARQVGVTDIVATYPGTDLDDLLRLRDRIASLERSIEIERALVRDADKSKNRLEDKLAEVEKKKEELEERFNKVNSERTEVITALEEVINEVQSREEEIESLANILRKRDEELEHAKMIATKALTVDLIETFF